MFHSRRSPDTATLKILASLAALGVLACLTAVAMMGAGTLARSGPRMLVVLLAMGALVAALLRLALEISARRAQGELTASELTTLTFPPESRLQRSRASRTR